MTNPFPGIDPFIEAQFDWQGFHTAFLTYMRDRLNDGLPDRYSARIEGQISIVKQAGDRTRYGADILVNVDPLRVSPRATASGTSAATMEPVLMPMSTRMIEEEVTDRWIEIRRHPDQTPVAVIELLSPTNKEEPGWSRYMERRLALVEQPVHLIEFDLLLRGHRLPMECPLPPGDFYTIVSRSRRRVESEVYAWSIRQRLPTIPIPLDAPDPDLPLDLASLYSMAYEKGRYARDIRRDRSLGLPLGPEDIAWIESIAGHR